MVVVSPCFAVFLLKLMFVLSRLDYSEVHNIDDSDDEPFVEQRNVQNTRQMPTSHSAKIDTKQSNKSYDNERSFDDEEDYSKFRKHSSARSSSSQYRSYLKNVLLQKQSASRLQRYLAVKKSIKWYVCH